jgi:hydroxyacylglutathione hydrolase
MQVTEHIHAIKIPFKIPIAPGKVIDREVYSYIVFGNEITLIDSGVMGAETIISDYIRRNGRYPKEISVVILTHSHPDHIGSVKAIKEATGCKVAAHSAEQAWIEDTEKQYRERPVPGFHGLVGGAVTIDMLLADAEIVTLDEKIKCEVMHTPGHSRGSITLFFADEKVIITGDALPLPNDLPIYEDIVASVDSIKRLERIKNIETLLSSWEAPLSGYKLIEKRIGDSILYLRRIHEAVLKAKAQGSEDLMNLCRFVVNEIGLPPSAANPLVARSFASNLAAMEIMDLF